MDIPFTGTRLLGKSGIEVSALGLGGWAIGGAMQSGDQPLGYAGVTDEASLAAIHAGVDAGITLFDTADAYGAGHSGRLLGEALRSEPQVRIATKFGNTIDEQTRELTGNDVTPAQVRRAVLDSLKRLRREQIDLYQLHHSDVTPAQAEDLVDVLEQLAGEGSIGWWGVSTDNPVVAGLFAAAPHCTAMQLELNVFDDNAEMLTICADNELAALCRSPLAMGLLGGRYSATTTLPADDVRGKNLEWLRWFRDGHADPGYLAMLDSVRAILTHGGRSLPQGALAWIWAHDAHAIPLPGFRNAAQVADTVGALSHGPLTSDEHDEVLALLRSSGAGE
jgi:aryl-alcohol dehydrogenase-like predicted oxidoreductase